MVVNLRASYFEYFVVEKEFRILPNKMELLELMNRTLLDKARLMVFDVGLPKQLWGKAILIAAY